MNTHRATNLAMFMVAIMTMTCTVQGNDDFMFSYHLTVQPFQYAKTNQTYAAIITPLGIDINEGCGAYSQKCHCQMQDFDPVAGTSTFAMTGQGTSGTLTTLVFTCFYQVMWHDLSKSSNPATIGGCSCSMHIEMRYNVNEYSLICPCLGEFTMPPATGESIDFKDTVHRLPRWPVV